MEFSEFNIHGLKEAFYLESLSGLLIVYNEHNIHIYHASHTPQTERKMKENAKQGIKKRNRRKKNKGT